MMKNNYIKIALNNKNEIRTIMSIEIPEISNNTFRDIDVKIDTGCPYTSIPIKKLGIKSSECARLKQQDCHNNLVKKHISFGVNDSKIKRESDKVKYNTKRYNEIDSISFEHKCKTIQIAGQIINNNTVRVSYDRTGNILIGMDIMKDWDIHIGKDVNTEEILFIACPYNKINNDYLLALDRHFNIGSSINSAILRDKMQTAEQ